MDSLLHTKETVPVVFGMIFDEIAALKQENKEMRSFLQDIFDEGRCYCGDLYCGREWCISYDKCKTRQRALNLGIKGIED